MSAPGQRALNRATLARQLLLERAGVSPLDAVGRLAGLQAQTPHTWYTGLWSRLADFDPREVSGLLTGREVVRIALMRSTIHLVTAQDALDWRPLVQPVIDRSTRGAFGKEWAGLDEAAVVASARTIFDTEPLTFAEAGRRLAEQWPGRDPAALAQLARAGLALVQTPPRGVWGASGLARHTTVEAWLGEPVTTLPSMEKLIIRYLAAFGPATVRDMQVWSGLTKLAEVVAGMRLADLGGGYYDLLDAPRPAPDTPAPVRYLYDFDNVLRSHHDRSRVVSPEYAARRDELMKTNIEPGTILVDGSVAALWTVRREKGRRGSATLGIEPLRKLTGRERDEVETEGASLLRFAAPEAAGHEIRYQPAR
ncbi:winged helix DNA-binding domain-containing protein [Longispora albida]|uniref:winged helix DNA-binding domain-containing protein n=1 Tax=Longispora albida TaxID=203523 RepID=UPI000376B4C8|nr:winged helix DNA-binding domain-containing protein [Longispora albida]